MPSTIHAQLVHTHTGAAHVCTQCIHHTRIHVHVQSICVHTHTYERQDYCVCTGMLCIPACRKTKGIRMGNAFILLFQATGSWANQVDIPTFPCRWEASINQWKIVLGKKEKLPAGEDITVWMHVTCPSSWVSSSEITGSLVCSWSGLPSWLPEEGSQCVAWAISPDAEM